MSEPPVVRFVTKHLDQGLASITPEQRERLKTARGVALAHRKVGAGARLAGLAGMFHLDLLTQRALARTAAAVVIAMVMSLWHAERYVLETAEIDSAILAEDMPMEVFTDKGFDQWLKSSGEQ